MYYIKASDRRVKKAFRFANSLIRRRRSNAHALNEFTPEGATSDVTLRRVELFNLIKCYTEVQSRNSSGHLHLLEIGAGKDLFQPIQRSKIPGLNQTLYDIEYQLDYSAVTQSIRSTYPNRLITTPRSRQEMVELLSSLNIEYISGDYSSIISHVRDYPIDIFFSFATLEHIPFESIEQLFGGIQLANTKTYRCIHLIDFSDHYSNFLPISEHNFLLYPPPFRQYLFPTAFYQNLKFLDDYITLFKEIYMQPAFIEVKKFTTVDTSTSKTLYNFFLNPKPLLDDLIITAALIVYDV